MGRAERREFIRIGVVGLKRVLGAEAHGINKSVPVFWMVLDGLGYSEGRQCFRSPGQELGTTLYPFTRQR